MFEGATTPLSAFSHLPCSHAMFRPSDCHLVLRVHDLLARPCHPRLSAHSALSAAGLQRLSPPPSLGSPLLGHAGHVLPAPSALHLLGHLLSHGPEHYRTVSIEPFPFSIPLPASTDLPPQDLAPSLCPVLLHHTHTELQGPSCCRWQPRSQPCGSVPGTLPTRMGSWSISPFLSHPLYTLLSEL